jgi:hypothetical protein
VKGLYTGSQNGDMQFVCALRSGSAVWFLGTDFTVGTLGYNANWNCKVLNEDSLNWSNACACSWTIQLYLKSGPIIVENCKIPTYNEANMIHQSLRTNGFPYWTSTKYDDSDAYSVHEGGSIRSDSISSLYRGVVHLAKISL